MATPPNDPQNADAASQSPAPVGPPTAVTAPAATAETPTTHTGEGFTPLVAEIRQRLGGIVARELDVQRRERELAEELKHAAQAARTAAERHLLEARQRLDERSAALDTQALEFTERQAELDQRAAEFADREARLLRDRDELLRGFERLRRRRTADRAQRHEDRQTSRTRQTQQRRLDDELLQRLTLARNDIATQRTELEQLRQALDERRAELDRRQQHLDAVAAELTPLRAEFAQQQRELDEHRSALTHASEEVARERADMQSQRTALDARWREMRSQHGDAIRRTEDVTAQQRLISQEREALEARLSRLDAREARLAEQAQSLDAAREELVRRDAALRERQQTLDELYSRAAAAEHDLASGQAVLTSVRDTLAAREATVREAAATLEVQAELLKNTPGPTTAAAAPSAAPAPTHLRARRRRATRGAVALLAGLGAASLTWLSTPPLVRTSVTVPITTVSADPNWAVEQHQLHIKDDARVRAALPDAALRAAWSQTHAAGRVAVSATVVPPTLSVSVSGTDPAANTRLLSAVVASYVEACNERPPTPELPPAYRDLPPRRDAVAQARATAATAATQQRAQVTTRPAADKRDTCLARVTELDESCRTLASQLETQRAELEQLSAHTPGGIVTAEALQTALGSDATYREDQKEHELAATAYQRELAVALQGLEAPLAAVQSALGTLATGVQEQRAVPAPTDVGAVLEQTQAEVERCTSQFGALGKAAPQWRQTAESLRAAEHASQLVDLHNSAIETVRLALEAGQTLGQHLQEAAEKLSGAGDGGTRQVVVAALLRSEARPLADAVTALTTAAQKMQFKENPELDTQNRKLRGVLARMNERSQVLKAQLQEAADAQAAREHAVKVDAARTAVSEQIAKREALLSEWGAALKVLRDLDAQLGERRVLEAEAAASEREVKSLDAQLAQIDATLAEARRQGTNPDRLGPVPAVQQEVVPDRNRTRVALLVGACMLAGTWLLLAWAVGDAWPIGRGRPARA